MTEKCKHPLEEISCGDCSDNAVNCNCFSCMFSVCTSCDEWFDYGCSDHEES